MRLNLIQPSGVNKMIQLQNPLPKVRLAIGALSLAGLFLMSQAQAGIVKIDPDAKAVEVINQTLTALETPNETTRIQMLEKLLHKSMLGPGGKGLDPSVQRFSYKKAVQNAQFYKNPVEIYEVHQGNVSTVGFKTTAEKGRRDKYFIQKKEGVAGRPAPVHIFWPDNGSAPKVLDFGSL